MPLTYPSKPLEGRDPAGRNLSANFTKASAQLTPRTDPTNQQEPCVGPPTRPSSPPAWATMPAFAVTPSTQAPHLEPLLTVENLLNVKNDKTRRWGARRVVGGVGGTKEWQAKVPKL